MRKKKAPVSLATARAIRVFPVPGGPYSRIPRGGWRTQRVWLERPVGAPFQSGGQVNLLPRWFSPHLHANGLEEGRVSEGELHHLFDLSQLLTDSSNVIIAHLIQRLLLILQTTKTHKHDRVPAADTSFQNELKIQSVCHSASTGSIYRLV